MIITLSQFVEAPIEHPNNAMTKITKDVMIETQEISIIRQIQYNQMLNEFIQYIWLLPFILQRCSIIVHFVLHILTFDLF